MPQEPPLKPAAKWTLIGNSPARVDLPEKVDGSATYGIDVRLPGMLYAAIKAYPGNSGLTPRRGERIRVIIRAPGLHRRS